MEIWIWAGSYQVSGEAGGRLIWGVWGAEPLSEYPITIIRFLRVKDLFYQPRLHPGQVAQWCPAGRKLLAGHHVYVLVHYFWATLQTGA